MKKIKLVFLCGLLPLASLSAQYGGLVKAILYDAHSRMPLAKARVLLLETSQVKFTGDDGKFVLSLLPPGDQTIQIDLAGYDSRSFEVNLSLDKEVDLGIIFLSPTAGHTMLDSDLVSLSQDDLTDSRGLSNNITGLLHSGRDLFQNRAAFDWGQAFFRVRGYDSKHGELLINGIKMNSLFNGRVPWNHWGGLNDVLRNRVLSPGLSPASTSFGSLLGSVNISTRSALNRPGLRITGSYSNKTYRARLMATYSSGLLKNGLAYSFSASRRWASQGYIRGTSYLAYGLFASLDYQASPKNSFNITAVFAPNKRGQSAAITSRAFSQMGRKYNPNWGFQRAKARSSRLREISAPLVFLTHLFETAKTSITTGFAFQVVKRATGRLDYSNIASPNPNYWRYLPHLSEKPQIGWTQLYAANSSNGNLADAGASRYMLYQDVTENEQLSLNLALNSRLTPNLSIDLSAAYKSLDSENYASPADLLGATFYLDSNPFVPINGQPARNDLLGSLKKGEGDRVKYNYLTSSSRLSAFGQFRFNFKKTDFFLTGTYVSTQHQREGLFLNESFPDNSLGKSELLSFTDLGFKGGFTYKLSGRNLFNARFSYFSQAPDIRTSFVNSRENNKVVDSLQSQKILASEISYIFRSPKFKARITGYFADFKGDTDLNFFFAQSGSGSDFFQEVVDKIDKRHLGFEMGLEYRASPTTKAFLAAAIGQHVYTNNARVAINFDTAGTGQDLINQQGLKDLGETYIKGLRLANGPQQAISLGWEFRGPDFWWIGATANYLSNAFVDVSTISRTNDFFIDPDDPFGHPVKDPDLELARELLKQEQFEAVYLLNLTGGKSWRLKKKYLSLFISINNAFDALFKTGGYEQSRTANYADLLEDNKNGEDQRSFGNKYWYGMGRTYFVNLAINF